MIDESEASVHQGRSGQADLAGTLALVEDERLTVLLAEDDPADALLVGELLADSGLVADLHLVTDVAGARKRLAEGRVDCLLLDLHLPDLDGVPALAGLLPSLGSTAVVVMTGLNDRAAGLAAVRAGAQDYLVKGQVEPEWFARALLYAVQRRRAQLAAADLQAAHWRAQENARLQRGLLPLPLLRERRVEVTSRYRPGREGALLGGDFYDVVETRDGRVHVVIGDVSGHGPDEAALGVSLRVAWRTLVLSGLDGPRLVDHLEQVLHAERRLPETFATLTTLSWSDAGREGGRHTEVDVIRAGHPGFLLRGGDGVRLAEPPPGRALGLGFGQAGAVWPVTRVRLAPGDSLVLFTDGLFETRTADGGRLDEVQLTSIAARFGDLGPADFVDTLIAATRDRTGHGDVDDVAVLHLSWVPAQGGRP